MKRSTLVAILTAPLWVPVFLIGLLAALLSDALDFVANVIACSLVWGCDRLSALDEPKEDAR